MSTAVISEYLDSHIAKESGLIRSIYGCHVGSEANNISTFYKQTRKKNTCPVT